MILPASAAAEAAFIMQTHTCSRLACDQSVAARRGCCHPPALVGHPLVSGAGELFDVHPQRAVDELPVGLAHVQEVGPEAADGVLGDVGQRLAHGGAEQEGTDGFVNGGRVAAEGRFGLDAF